MPNKNCQLEMKTANVYDLASKVSVVTDAGTIQLVFKTCVSRRFEWTGPQAVQNPSIHLEGFPLNNYVSEDFLRKQIYAKKCWALGEDMGHPVRH